MVTVFTNGIPSDSKMISAVGALVTYTPAPPHHRDADTHTHHHPHPHTDTHPHPDAHLHAHPHTDGHRHRDSNRDGYCLTNADQHTDRDRHGYAKRDPDGDGEPHADRYANPDPEPAEHAHANSPHRCPSAAAAATRPSTVAAAGWSGSSPTQASRRTATAYRSARQLCADGDPSCDFQPSTSGVCEFQVQVCLNNLDTHLPACIPGGLDSVTIQSPNPARTRNLALRAALAQDLAALQNALAHLLDPANPEAGYVNAPPLSAAQQNFCSAPFSIAVPVNVRPGRTSKRSVRLTTRSTSNSLVPRTHRSSLTLTCKSRPL